jgi:hypothetical protein
VLDVGKMPRYTASMMKAGDSMFKECYLQLAAGEWVKTLSLLFVFLLSHEAWSKKPCHVDVTGYATGEDLLIPLSKSSTRLRADWGPSDLVVLPGGHRLRKDAADAFLRMQAAAAGQEMSIGLRSGYRSFRYQTQVFCRRQSEDRAISIAEPGLSEHQLGTAVDLGFFSEAFARTKEFNWLVLNAHEYGYVMSFPESEDRAPGSAANPLTGFRFEPWHWRYIGIQAAKSFYVSNMDLYHFLLLNR